MLCTNFIYIDLNRQSIKIIIFTWESGPFFFFFSSFNLALCDSLRQVCEQKLKFLGYGYADKFLMLEANLSKYPMSLRILRVFYKKTYFLPPSQCLHISNVFFLHIFFKTIFTFYPSKPLKVERTRR